MPNVNNKERNEMEEKLIDILWEVKEGKKHPNRAYKELCTLFGVSSSNCGHEWEITSGRCVKCGKSKYY